MNKLAADLESEEVTLQNSISAASNRVKEIQSRLNELDGLLFTTDLIVKAAENNLAESKEACARKQQEYNEQSVSRRSETDIVERLIEFITERIANAPG